MSIDKPQPSSLDSLRCANCREPIFKDTDGRWFHRTGFIDSPFCGVGGLGSGNVGQVVPKMAAPKPVEPIPVSRSQIQVQCERCDGTGKQEVTREMAIDAGNPKLEGDSISCFLCGGGGFTVEPTADPSLQVSPEFFSSCGKDFETICNLPKGHKGMCGCESRVTAPVGQPKVSVLITDPTKQPTDALVRPYQRQATALPGELSQYRGAASPSQIAQPAPVIPVSARYPHKSCNRHSDCEAAEAEVLARNPGKTKGDISINFHCHDEDCEDCFGK